MREFNKVSAKYWMTNLSRKFKQQGCEAMLLSIYLQTNHHTHSLGIYYLPISYIAHDIGLDAKKVQSLIQNLIQLNFCRYDFEQEYIWLKNYALEQAGGPLKGGDNRILHLNKYYQELPYLNYMDEFYQTHKDDLHLSLPPQELNDFVDPLEALPSTKTKTETEKKTETQTEPFVAQTRQDVKAKSIETVFEHWKHTMNHSKAKLDNKRRRLILQALQLGYDCQQLCEAITGCSLTPHNIGDNERGERYDGLHVILRNADQIDRFIHNNNEPPKQLTKTMQQSRNTYHSLEDWMQGADEVNHAVC